MHLSRTLRRHVALAIGGLVLLAPVLSSCGFAEATGRVNTLVTGASSRTGTVAVLSAVVVSASNGSGALVATLSNASTTDVISLTTVAGGSTDPLTVPDFAPVSVAKQGYVNLADQHGIPLSGSFVAGDVIPMTLTFSNGEVSTLDVPVVTDCDVYASILPTPHEKSSGSQLSPSATASPYDCDYPGDNGDDTYPGNDAPSLN